MRKKYQRKDRKSNHKFQIVRGQELALLHAPGHINAKVLQLISEGKRYSLMISVAAPGCSGGPVISETGRAVAVVSQENALTQGNAAPITFISAVLSCYLA